MGLIDVVLKARPHPEVSFTHVEKRYKRIHEFNGLQQGRSDLQKRNKRTGICRSTVSDRPPEQKRRIRIIP